MILDAGDVLLRPYENRDHGALVAILGEAELMQLVLDERPLSNAQAEAFIDSHFVAVKVDFDADPKLSAEFERAQAIANLPAGLPLTAFFTPDGKLYSGGGYFPKEATADKPAFRQTLEEASRMFRDLRATIEREGFQMKIGE